MVILLLAFVIFEQKFLDFFSGTGNLFCCLLYTNLPWSMNKYSQGIGTVLEYIVYTTSYNYIRFFFCKVVDNLCLIIEDVFV